MGTETLVSFDIENGKEVIDALDRDGKNPNVALWAKLPDYESWRLVIASDRLDQSRNSPAIPRSMRPWKRLEFRSTDSLPSLCVPWTIR